MLLQRKKYPNLSGGYVGVPTGKGNYHAGQFQLVRQMSHGLQFRVGYTRSRSMGVEGQAIYNSSVIQDEWNQDKPNFYRKSDVPNTFFSTFVWQLPGQRMRGLSGAVIGGWQVAGVISSYSGWRVDVRELYPQWPGAAGVFVKPVLLRDPNLPASQRTLNRWFDTDAVQQPAPNQFGSDAAINAVRADPIRNLNATISKFFGIREGHRIQFRAEFFNAFNHPHFGDPDALRGSGTFGKVTSADPGRDIQLALKYQF